MMDLKKTVFNINLNKETLVLEHDFFLKGLGSGFGNEPMIS